MERVTYKMLHKIPEKNKSTSPAYADNVCCGLVKYGGKKIIGCGKHVRTRGFYYKSPKYGTISTAYLCPECSKKAGTWAKKKTCTRKRK